MRSPIPALRSVAESCVLTLTGDGMISLDVLPSLCFSPSHLASSPPFVDTPRRTLQP